MPYTDTEHKPKVGACSWPKRTVRSADSGGMREFSGRQGLRRLGIVISRAEPARGVAAERMFMVVGANEGPRVPQDMIETQQLRILR